MKNKFQTSINCIVIILIVMPCILTYKGLCRAEMVDRVVAVVNNEVITFNELNEAANAYTEKIKSFDYSADEERAMLFRMREDVLNQLINQKLTDQQAAKYDLSVSDKELNNTIERIKEAKYLTDEELRKMVAKDGLTYDEFRDRIKFNILRSKVLDIEVKSKIVITRDDMKAYYESHKKDYVEEKTYHLLNIIKKVASDADSDDRNSAFSAIEKIYAKLVKGQKFEEISRDFAEASSDAESTDLGKFKFDELSQQIQGAIKGLKEKEFTKILETEPGYQIIYIKEIARKPGRSFDEAYSEIQEILSNDILDKKFKLWIEQLRQKSYIKVIK